MSKTIYTPEEWKRFSELYLEARDNGATFMNAYRAAKSKLVPAGYRCPSWKAVWKRLHNHPEAEPAKVVEQAPQVVPEKAGSEVGLGAVDELQEENRKLRIVARLYRFRSESDIDAVCDELLPELGGAENE